MDLSTGMLKSERSAPNLGRAYHTYQENEYPNVSKIELSRTISRLTRYQRRI